MQKGAGIAASPHIVDRCRPRGVATAVAGRRSGVDPAGKGTDRAGAAVIGRSRSARAPVRASVHRLPPATMAWYGSAVVRTRPSIRRLPFPATCLRPGKPDPVDRGARRHPRPSPDAAMSAMPLDLIRQRRPISGRGKARLSPVHLRLPVTVGRPRLPYRSRVVSKSTCACPTWTAKSLISLGFLRVRSPSRPTQTVTTSESHQSPIARPAAVESVDCGTIVTHRNGCGIQMNATLF